MSMKQSDRFTNLYFQANQLRLEMEELIKNNKVGKLEMKDVRRISEFANETAERARDLYFCVRDE